jgi:hypothetical protein
MSHKFKAGDTLFFVPSRHGSKRVVTIKTVGRKWLTLAGFAEGQRIAIDDPALDVEIPKYGSVGRCYLTETHYAGAVALDLAWNKLRTDVNNKWRAADCITVERIAEARKLLGLDGSAK